MTALGMKAVITAIVLAACYLQASSAARASLLALAQKVSFDTATPTMPTIAAEQDAAISEVEVRPDLRVMPQKFSEQNAFFFATLSKLAYRTKSEAEGFLKGNATCEGLGFTDFHWFEPSDEKVKKALMDNVHDTEAYVAARDDLLIVAFRGTQQKADWVTSFSFSQTDAPDEWNLGTSKLEIHQGVWDGLDSVWHKEGMLDTIRGLYNENRDRKLYLTGHSLGGALATLAAAHLVFREDMYVEGMYTMGSPRVFNDALAKIWNDRVNGGLSMKNKYFRCRNNNDIVCTLPPGTYEHVGNEIYVDRFGMVGKETLIDRILGRMSAYLQGKFLEDINDHATSEYVRHFKELIIESRVSFLDKTKSILKHVGEKVLDPEKAAKKKQEVESVKAAAKEAALEM